MQQDSIIEKKFPLNNEDKNFCLDSLFHDLNLSPSISVDFYKIMQTNYTFLAYGYVWIIIIHSTTYSSLLWYIK